MIVRKICHKTKEKSKDEMNTNIGRKDLLKVIGLSYNWSCDFQISVSGTFGFLL